MSVFHRQLGSDMLLYWHISSVVLTSIYFEPVNSIEYNRIRGEHFKQFSEDTILKPGDHRVGAYCGCPSLMGQCIFINMPATHRLFVDSRRVLPCTNHDVNRPKLCASQSEYVVVSSGSSFWRHILTPLFILCSTSHLPIV